MEAISIDTFWKILHDPASRGFDLKYRKAGDGSFGMKQNLGKSGKRFAGESTKGKLRYDLIEKGSVLLEDIDGLGRPFTLRNRLIIAIRLPRTNQWLRIIHKNY
ncbi:hypothetical protein [Dyadobacter crusticola]|uniref:hypothetical protein n=1 Tax=Dyadobacter crusticola TaxID=292407 RepID=UPI0004E1DDC2|nr:hypothetical protein [Dyadobacter crusticola]